MPDACDSPLLTLQGLLGLLDTVLEYVAILDRNMRYLFVNEARARCVGLPRKDIIEVWDTGAGIASDDLDLIFEDFYQRDNPARDRSRGLGLGLGMVKRAARIIKSELTVRSRPGRGSVFSFPLQRAGAQAGAQELGVEAG